MDTDGIGEPPAKKLKTSHSRSAGLFNAQCRRAKVFDSFFKSTVFEFRVEDEKFYVHQRLLASYSKPLERLINVDMQEKRQGYAVLNGINAATFERSVSWLYTGSYVVPEPRLYTTKMNGKEEQHTGYSRVFKDHARLYVFADEKDILGLKEKALQNLYDTKNKFRDDRSSRGRHISRFLLYAYRNTPKTCAKERDPLRTFAMELLKSYSSNICKRNSFLQMLREAETDLIEDVLHVILHQRPPKN